MVVWAWAYRWGFQSWSTVTVVAGGFVPPAADRRSGLLLAGSIAVSHYVSCLDNTIKWIYYIEVFFQALVGALQSILSFIYALPSFSESYFSSVCLVFFCIVTLLMSVSILVRFLFFGFDSWFLVFAICRGEFVVFREKFMCDYNYLYSIMVR